MPLFKKTLWLMLIFISGSLHLYGLHSLSFEELSFENVQLSSFEGQRVQVRGFWYPLSEDEGILASQPQLKSCCLKAPAKIEQQILVKGEALSLLPPQRALTLEGIFHIQPAYNSKGELIQFFILNQAEEIPLPASSIMWALLGAAVLILTCWCVFKFRKTR